MFNFYWRGLKNGRTRFGEITVKIFGLQATPGPQRLIRPGGDNLAMVTVTAAQNSSFLVEVKV